MRIEKLYGALMGSPSKIRIVRDKVIGVRSGQAWQEVDISEVDSDKIMQLIADIDAVSKKKTDLGAKLRELGMSID